MKKLSTIVVCCVSFLLFVGCEKAGVEGKSKIDQRKRFPDIMVGRWEAKTGKGGKISWVFNIGPDGTIPKIWHPMVGKVEFAEDEAHIEKNKPPISREYFLAPCEAKYDPATNEVSIEVVVDYYKIQVFDKVLEGSNTDIFRGPLSKDGKTWKAEWLSSLKVEGKKPIKPRKPSSVVFTKVDTK